MARSPRILLVRRGTMLRFGFARGRKRQVNPTQAWLQGSWLALARLNIGFVPSFSRLPLARLFWLAAGKPIPPPPVVKQQVLLRYAERFAIDELIETGTFAVT